MLKLLQWNILYKENIDNIIKELKRFDADIVSVQELCTINGDNSNVNKLKNVYPNMYYEVADTFSDGYSQGNAILSKYPITKTFKYFVQERALDNEDYSKEGRIYIEVELDINGQKLNVGTTHLSYTHKFKETLVKDQEVNKLISLIDKREKYIFAGDLNTTGTSKYIKRIEEHLINWDTTNTWTTKPFSYQGFEEHNLNWKLDYVFTSPDINVREVKVLETMYSDHLPILCIFDL